MKTEEQIRAYTIGELRPLTASIVVSDHDPGWPASFEREATRICAILGARVELLEHAGSTSVPDLPAKPIIDIILAVQDSSDEAAYVPAMETAGYVLRIREPEWLEHRVFKGPDTDINLHVFTVGCPEIAQMLLLRLAPSPSRGSRSLRRSEARPGEERMAVHPELRGRQDCRRAADPGKGADRGGLTCD